MKCVLLLLIVSLVLGQVSLSYYTDSACKILIRGTNYNNMCVNGEKYECPANKSTIDYVSYTTDCATLNYKSTQFTVGGCFPKDNLYYKASCDQSAPVSNVVATRYESGFHGGGCMSKEVLANSYYYAGCIVFGTGSSKVTCDPEQVQIAYYQNQDCSDTPVVGTFFSKSCYDHARYRYVCGHNGAISGGLSMLTALVILFIIY